MPNDAGIHSANGVTVREATRSDAAAIAAIYNPYVAHSIVTFEEAPVDAEEISRRLDDVHSLSLPWLVATHGDDVVGYAYAMPWKSRVGYRFSVETTVYLAPGSEGRGIGSSLYAALFEILASRGIRVVIGGIALPNDASIALHEKFGMKKVAQFEKIGVKFDRWIDVGYWERILPQADS